MVVLAPTSAKPFDEVSLQPQAVSVGLQEDICGGEIEK
jgi:hypothetical protein